MSLEILDVQYSTSPRSSRVYQYGNSRHHHALRDEARIGACHGSSKIGSVPPFIALRDPPHVGLKGSVWHTLQCLLTLTIFNVRHIPEAYAHCLEDVVGLEQWRRQKCLHGALTCKLSADIRSDTRCAHLVAILSSEAPMWISCTALTIVSCSLRLEYWWICRRCAVKCPGLWGPVGLDSSPHAESQSLGRWITPILSSRGACSHTPNRNDRFRGFPSRGAENRGLSAHYYRTLGQIPFGSLF